MTDSMTKQVDLERDMLELGVSRYRKETLSSLDKGTESSTRPGSQLLKAVIEPVAKAITDFIESAEGKAGRNHSAVKYLKQLDPYVAAFIIGRVILDQISQDVSLTAACIQVANRLEDEVRFMHFENFTFPKDGDREARKAERLYRKILNGTSRSQNKRHKRNVLRHAMNKYGVPWQDWSKVGKLTLGRKCIDIFCNVTKLTEVVTFHKGRNNTVSKLVATKEAMDWIKNKNSYCELLAPVNLPMVVPPLDWTGSVGGGYHTDFLTPLTLVKTKHKAYLQELNNVDMPAVYATINALQRTSYRVNDAVLEVLNEVKDRGWAQQAGLPAAEPIELPELTDEIKADPELLVQWKRKATKIHESNHRRTSKRIQLARTVYVADRFKDEKEIFFPYTMDFRGRFYPVPGSLNPQGDDVAKSLLTFAVGKPLGTQAAADALAVHVANKFGMDKLPLADRVRWTHDYTHRIMAVAMDPLTYRWWTEADKPWQFLAACFEWAGYQTDGLEFESSLPIGVDGTANGLQHFSAMLRDAEGGAAVNLTPADVPADIYQEVAARAAEFLELDVLSGGTMTDAGAHDERIAARNVELATAWLDSGLVNRTLAKRPVMVFPYGGTLYSCKGFVKDVLDEVAESGGKHPFMGDDDKLAIQACSYMGTVLWTSLNNTVAKASEAMDWLQDAARKVAKAGLPVNWTAPSGLPVMQSYMETKARRVKTQLGESITFMTMREDTDKIDKRRMANAISPNFVHSMDAAALSLCVSRAVGHGVTHFQMVHDDYGTHAADMPGLQRDLRSSFVGMYQGNDVLANFAEDVKPLLPDGEELLPIPDKGTLDISHVLESPFFFS